MVGAFGEVQVMDWGLAKVLAEGGVADEERASRERERPEEGRILLRSLTLPAHPEMVDLRFTRLR